MTVAVLQMHLSIAEQGKVHALAGQHQEALRHYREAMRLAVSGKAPEVFFRHYTQCVLESLELLGSYDEIVRFCNDADAHYQALDKHLQVQKRDHGSILERLGIVLLKQGHRDEAQATLVQACELAGKGALPLAEEIVSWLKRGMHMDERHLLRSQQKHKYFVVRADQVDKQRARSLPAAGPDAQSGPSTLLSEIAHG